MELGWNRLMAALEAFENVRVCRSGEEKTYLRLSCMTPDAAREPGLYICDEWPDEALDEGFCILRVSEDHSAPPEKTAYAAIALYSKDTVERVCSDLTNRLFELDSWLNEVEKRIYMGDGLQDIVTLSEPYLHRAMIVWDNGFRVLAYTRQYASDYVGYRETIQRGYTAPEVMKHLKSGDYFHDINLSNHVLYKSAVEDSRYNNIYTKLGVDSILGYACVFCEADEISFGYVALCDEFFHALNPYFEHNRERDTLGQYMYESLVFEMINDANMPQARIKERLAGIGDIPFEADFLLVRLRMNNPVAFPGEYINNEISKAMPTVKTLVDKGDVLVLSIFSEQYGSRERYYERIVRDIAALGKSYGTKMGVSIPFRCLASLHAANRQCCVALDIGGRMALDTPCYYYADVYGYHMLACLGDEMDLAALCEPGLLEHMEEVDGEQLALLKAYLCHERRVAETAQALNMHRNSVTYHVRKLEAVFGTSFDTHAERRRWLISFDILEMLKFRE